MRAHDLLHWDNRGTSRAACGLRWSDKHDTGGAQTYSFREFVRRGDAGICQECVERFVDSETAPSQPDGGAKP